MKRLGKFNVGDIILNKHWEAYIITDLNNDYSGYEQGGFLGTNCNGKHSTGTIMGDDLKGCRVIGHYDIKPMLDAIRDARDEELEAAKERNGSDGISGSARSPEEAQHGDAD